MSTATIELPWPPTVNHYWQSVVRGRRVWVRVSDEGNAYRSVVGDIVRQTFPGLTQPILSRLSVYIVASPPDRRRRDLDNILKSLLDALTASGVWGDDSQIDSLYIDRGEVETGGRVIVAISAIKGTNHAVASRTPRSKVTEEPSGQY